ncbi:helix-turn-helix transcriptional regulator [uncultured Anaeromusa sp.]|uniref:helix-turn-helix domain-containing protein n=1 Tax=uncultured Anaeromusa sp. TaxID=673273 RepID=UPI0029C65DFF|nr:helix-turn-helix transcriptional regulator [uncultured Anaeromusa sp.]
MAFNERIKTLRLEKNLTQDELAKATGLSRSAIGMYESGSREPNFETLEVLADFFNVDMNYLLGRSEIPNRPTYYLDPEVAELADQLHKNPGMRILFDASKKLTKEDIQFVMDMVSRMKKDDGQ